MHYFYHEVKEYRWPTWDVKADFSRQSIRNAWVEAVAKSNPTIRVRMTCQNGKYIILDTR
jgi:phage pi2 protein 07